MTTEINIKKVMEDLKVLENASKSGTHIPPQPASNDTGFDTTQKDIVGHFSKLLGNKQETVRKYIRENFSKLDSLENDIESNTIEDIPDKARNKITTTLFSEYKDELKKAYKEHLESNRFFRAFQRDNHLTERPAVYPDSSILHWSIIFALFVGESIGNSYFFAQASSLGFIGGFFQAMLVSLVNLGLALTIGKFILPYKNKVNQDGDKQFEVITYVILALMIALIMVFNLTIAHYREIIADDPLQAIILAIPHLVDSFFGIKNLDAWMLFGIGDLAALIAVFKAYGSDDIYPKYGAIDRRNKYFLAKYDNIKKEMHNKIVAIIEEHEQEIVSKREKYRTCINQYRYKITTSETSYDSFLDEIRNIGKVCNQVLKKYRARNQSVRGRESPIPKYFKEEFKFDEKYTELEKLDLTKQKENSIKYDNDVKNISALEKETKAKLRETSDDILNSKLSKYYEEIYKEVKNDAMLQYGNDEIIK